MFKSILPTAKRNAGSDGKDLNATPFSPAGEGKENNRPGSLPQISQKSPVKASLPITPHSYDGKRVQHIQTVHFPGKKLGENLATDREFEKLLDDLQIPPTLRPKLATLESPVKAAMLRSSHVLIPDSAALPVKQRPKLRRSLSSTHIESPLAPFMLEGPQRPSSAMGHSRGVSIDTPRLASGSYNGINAKQSSSKSGKGTVRDLSAAALCTMLSDTSSIHLEVDFVKKLRLLLRNESASWSEAFLRQGGYAALLTRLIEILEIEWREEQHDDQVLHELLRCFKALSTSSIGCFALRSSCPTPFVQLVSLLYSDKKPGDLCTRQLIVDLLLILFEIYPSTSSTGQSARLRREAFEQSAAQAFSPTSTPAIFQDALPAPHNTLYSLVRALLLTPAPPPSESPSIPISPHAFIASLHTPRIFKSYLQELSDICRDYFWVFCHPQNCIWNLEQTDEVKVERPRAPGGMTGGVEFEAMNYLTSHFQLINALGKVAQELNLPPENEHSAHRFHVDLFASGIERIILTTRKASTTYYSTLHLEISRYVALAYRARFDVPWTVSRVLGMPPSHLCKPGVVSRNGSPRGSPNKSRSSNANPPTIPTPKKVDPIKF
ncbi:armadillo-type protein [Hysterangium stoloniferum]|nr:armadillo-type protein [Hysterangium stoloniferum]